MLYSDDAFAGGLSQAHLTGDFGMVLHEHDKYNGSHRARKSFHFFDGTIVCLGTDIENLNTEYPTETTVFQLAAITPETRRYWESYQSDGQTYIDPNGVGYYISKASRPTARYEKNFPQVTVGERSTKPTSGDWVSLTLQHGKAPKGASYEYAVLPHTDAAALKAFAKKPTYKILRQDRNAHIVRSPADGLTSYVLFETPQALPDGGLLQKADTSCLVMIREYKDKLLLTVSQPDLALYRGPSDEAFDKDGKRIERSIYSRPWTDNESQEIPVTVTLKGQWKVAETPYCKVLSADKNQTVLRFTCRDAASLEVELKRQGEYRLDIDNEYPQHPDVLPHNIRVLGYKTWGCFGVIHPHFLGEYIRVLWVFGIGVLAFLSYRERYWKRLFNMFRADCLLLTDSLPVCWSYEWSFSLCGLRPAIGTPRNFSFSLIAVPHRLAVALDRR